MVQNKIIFGKIAGREMHSAFGGGGGRWVQGWGGGGGEVTGV